MGVSQVIYSWRKGIQMLLSYNCLQSELRTIRDSYGYKLTCKLTAKYEVLLAELVRLMDDQYTITHEDNIECQTNNAQLFVGVSTPSTVDYSPMKTHIQGQTGLKGNSNQTSPSTKQHSEYIGSEDTTPQTVCFAVVLSLVFLTVWLTMTHVAHTFIKLYSWSAQTLLRTVSHEGNDSYNLVYILQQ